MGDKGGAIRLAQVFDEFEPTSGCKSLMAIEAASVSILLLFDGQRQDFQSSAIPRPQHFGGPKRHRAINYKRGIGKEANVAATAANNGQDAPARGTSHCRVARF